MWSNERFSSIRTTIFLMESSLLVAMADTSSLGEFEFQNIAMVHIIHYAEITVLENRTLTRRLERSARCSNTPRLAYQANKVVNERVQWIGFAPGQADLPFGFVQSRIQQGGIRYV